MAVQTFVVPSVRKVLLSDFTIYVRRTAGTSATITKAYLYEWSKDAMAVVGLPLSSLDVPLPSVISTTGYSPVTVTFGPIQLEHELTQAK